MKAANDLSIDIFELNRLADWDEAFDELMTFIRNEYKTSEAGETIVGVIREAQEGMNGDVKKKGIDKLYSQMDLINVLSELIEIDENKNSLEKKLVELREKHNITKTLRDGIKLRDAFNKERPHYLIQKVFDNRRFPTSSLFRLTEAPAAILAEMIDDMLQNLRGKDIVSIHYEDLNGSRKNILCRYQPIIEGNEEMRATPSPYIFGTSVLDAFLIVYYYDIVAKNWVEIPVDLIERIEYEGNTDFGDMEFLITRKISEDEMPEGSD